MDKKKLRQQQANKTQRAVVASATRRKSIPITPVLRKHTRKNVSTSTAKTVRNTSEIEMAPEDFDIDTELWSTIDDTSENADLDDDNNAPPAADAPDEEIDIAEVKEYNNEIVPNNVLATHEFEEYRAIDDHNKITEYGLYPNLNDPDFNVKIANKREFWQYRNADEILAGENMIEKANEMCVALSEKEFLHHQLFVRNFMSFNTPYNSLLLFHGLGSGKSYAAVGIAEEMRQYNKQIGITQRIMFIASENVQNNFKNTLFNERQLVELPQGLYKINSTIGTALMREINPTNQVMSKEVIGIQIRSIINQYYTFMGYNTFGNHIEKISQVDEKMVKNAQDREAIKIKQIRQHFSNRLIIIDEVHNIRITDDNIKDRKTGKMLFEIAKHAVNTRFVLMSATPMYNNPREIVWLTNLMNLNDKRSYISPNSVFDKAGNFLPQRRTPDGHILESGYDLLRRKLTGYVSYVRGENPYTFPFRIYPDKIVPELVITNMKYPMQQINGKQLEQKIKHTPVFMSHLGTYQDVVYKKYVQLLLEERKDVIERDLNAGPSDELNEHGDSYGFNFLREPLQILNMTYPTSTIDSLNSLAKLGSTFGTRGLDSVMTHGQHKGTYPNVHSYDYTPSTLRNYGRIFSPHELYKYSGKLASVCDMVRHSTGIVIIYSQNLDAGLIPMALALEEMGFTRYSSVENYGNLLKTTPIAPISYRMNATASSKEDAAHYIVITGDKRLTGNVDADLKRVTDPENRDGRLVKVVLVSRAGSEGLDFANVRQVHIIDPWYNLNRIEQIFGRGVRNLSHCGLPFIKRNVELYLHGSLLLNSEEESADMFVYRLAERKAIQIGYVTRMMKEISVDCLLNSEQSKFAASNLIKMADNNEFELELSTIDPETGQPLHIQFQAGDQPFTAICDYMEDCEYKCSNASGITTLTDKPDNITYNNNYVKMSNDQILKHVRDLFIDRVSYTRDELISALLQKRTYDYQQIYNTLTYLIETRYEYLYDKHGRLGRLINKGEMYLFQPLEVTDEKMTTEQRDLPLPFKRQSYQMEISKKLHDYPIEIIGDDVQLIIKPDKMNLVELLSYIEECVQNSRIMRTNTTRDFYYSCAPIRRHLRDIYAIGEREVDMYVIHHAIDMLRSVSKLKLLQHFFLSGAVPKNELEKMMYDYLARCVADVGGGNKVALVFSTEGGYRIYRNSDENYKRVPEWHLTGAADRRMITGLKSSFVIERNSLLPYVGFVQIFKDKHRNRNVGDKDASVAMKYINTKPINFSTCASASNKSDIVHKLNAGVLLSYKTGPIKYTKDNVNEFSNTSLCCLSEFLLRHCNKNGKIGFLSAEHSAVNGIELISTIN